MRIIDMNGNDLEESEIDLEHGMLEDCYWAPPEAFATIDNETKHALDPEDFEWVKRYIPLTNDEKSTIDKNQENASIQMNIADIISSSDEAICSLYEENENKDSILGQQDQAICELYEMLQ